MGSPGLDTNDVDLLIILLRAASTISLPMKEGVADKTNMNSNELRVLMALGGEGALAGHELADVTGLQAMNVSRALAGLAAQGLVTQEVDPANRRRKPHRLTEQGVSAFAGLTPVCAEMASFLFATLSQKERAAFTALMTKVATRISEWSAEDRR